MSETPITSIYNRILTAVTIGTTSQPSPDLDKVPGKVDDPILPELDACPRRPIEEQEFLTAALRVPLKRLGFPSQPIPSQTGVFDTWSIREPDDVEGANWTDDDDWNAIFLRDNLGVLFDQLYGTDSPVYTDWNAHIKRTMGTVHILTLLDVAAIIPQAHWGEDVRATVDAFTAVLEAFHAVKGINWTNYPTEDTLDGRLGRCNDYAFIQRLIFNECRLHGKSLDEHEARMREIREKFDIPMDFDLTEELQLIEMAYNQQHEEIEEAFREALELEWVGPMIPVTDVSTEIENPEGIDCVVCRSDICPSPGVLTVPCQHAYHKECLERWIHAAQGASHLCPYCRTELFPRPEYQPKDEELCFRNYEQELEDIEDQFYWLSWIQKSADWFEGELAMQRGYERLETERLETERLETERLETERLDLQWLRKIVALIASGSLGKR